MSGRVSADNGIRASAASEAKRRRGREFTPRIFIRPFFRAAQRLEIEQGWFAVRVARNPF